MAKKLDIKQMAEDVGKAASGVAESVGKTAQSVADGMGKGAQELADKTKTAVTRSQTAILNAVDQNGNGEVDIEDVIIAGLRLPGVGIDRENFLRKELYKNFPEEVIEDAVAYNPLHAGIPAEQIDKIANEVIKYERACVSGISAALGAVPGGLATAVATVPVDIAQYYGCMLRATQKLMYLYGFPAIDTEEKGQSFDSETINILIICLGVMYGAAGANNALKAMAKGLASGVEKQLMRMALTKGTFYPIVKNVAKWFSVKMTKEVFAGFFKKAIPVVGGVIGGGITFLSFKPCCDKLKASLQNTMLSNADYNPKEEDDDLFISDEEIILEGEYTEA